MQNIFDKSLPSCSALSIQVHEQLFGTAPLTRVWIMVEYNHPFGEKALEESNIPDTVKTRLSDLQKSIPASRVLLIRQEIPTTNTGISMFVGLSSKEQPLLYEFHFTSYEELVNLDVASLSAGAIELQENIRTEPLFLVCTNGKRDPCCAQWGRQVYLQMASLAGNSVWQTSHVGGHRFAANVICLPHGIYQGRVRPDQAATLIDDYRHNQLTPHNYRGRAHYSPEVQVAEYYLLAQTNLWNIDAFQFLHTDQTATNFWKVIFISRVDGSKYHLEISAHQSPFDNYESCSKPNKRAPRLQYQLEKWSKS